MLGTLAFVTAIQGTRLSIAWFWWPVGFVFTGSIDGSKPRNGSCLAITSGLNAEGAERNNHLPGFP